MRNLFCVGIANVALVWMCSLGRAQDNGSNELVDDFNAGREGWQVYDYIGPGVDAFHNASWESSGGVGESGYVWADDSRWGVDTPEDPDSILSFIIYSNNVGGAAIDMRDADLSVYLRGNELDLKGGSAYFWVLNSYLGTRWHYTAQPLVVTEDAWGEGQSVVLHNNEALWHRSWSRNSPNSLDDVLRSVDSYGFSFLGFSEEVTGAFAMDELELRLKTIPSPPRPPANKPNPHYWAFDEPDGNFAPDLLDIGTPGDRPGTFHNMDYLSNRSHDIPAAIGNGRSLSFNGADEYVSISPGAGSFQSTEDFSVSLWYKGTESRDNGDFGYNLLGWDSGNLYAQVTLRDGKVEYLHYDEAGWQHNLASTSDVNDGQWHSIVYVNHGTVETGTLYIDGVIESDGQSSAISGSWTFEALEMMRGYAGIGSSVYTEGLLDDVSIYEHSLTQAEVTAIMTRAEDADFDGDGDVDGGDFLIWQRGVGLTSQVDKSSGDGNGDGNVDDADLAGWKKQFGVMSIPANSTLQMVPEARNLILALIGLTWFIGRRQSVLRCPVKDI